MQPAPTCPLCHLEKRIGLLLFAALVDEQRRCAAKSGSPEWRLSALMRLDDTVIAVPVRNEAARLPALLFALARQRGASRFRLCLFFDSCTDNGRSIVEALASTLPYPLTIGCSDALGPPNAGRARAAAGRLALSRSPQAILSTDADSEPEPDWVAANLAALGQAELVAGRILLPETRAVSVQTRLTAYYDRLHRYRRRIDPVPWEDEATHHWTSACSLALRADTYRALDGFAPQQRGEDADLADRAWRAGYRLRRDSRAVVRTSARRQGRAEGGFAAMLAGWDAAPALPRVAHPEDESWRYQRHALVRQGYADGQLQTLAATLRLDQDDLARIAAEVPNSEALTACVVGAPPGGMREVSLAHAEVALEALEAEQLEGAA